MEKAFEKQTKTIEDQREKQVNVNKDNNANVHSYQNELLLSKEREIFKNIYNKRLHKLEKLTKKVNYGGQKFTTKSNGNKTDFTKVVNPLVFPNDIKTKQNKTTTTTTKQKNKKKTKEAK